MQIRLDPSSIPENQALQITLMGMGVVFTGLILVSLFILFLPRMLELLDKLLKREAVVEDAVSEEEEDLEREAEIRAAIAMVLEHALTPDDGSSVQRITIRRKPADSIWREVSQMWSLSTQPPF